MTDTFLVARPRWALERRWDHARKLPRRWVLVGDSPTPFDFTGRIRGVCADVAARCPELGHIDTATVLFNFTPARNRSAYGLQARVTPMRFDGGALARRFRGVGYQVQRYFVAGHEMKYIVTFCLPRFLDQPFEEKLVTVFHELYHIGPQFDGDLRRHEGRYAVHSKSKKAYDERMGELVRSYLANHPEPESLDFLRLGAKDLGRRYGGVTAVAVPRPKMIPIPSDQWSVVGGQ